MTELRQNGMTGRWRQVGASRRFLNATHQSNARCKPFRASLTPFGVGHGVSTRLAIRNRLQLVISQTA
jgi:hypothetical protein